MQLPVSLEAGGVRFGSVPERLELAQRSGVLWQASAGRFLLDAPGVARYLVTREDGITIDAAEGAQPRQLVDHLCATPLAAFLYQRGILALHGMLACSSRGAVLVGGDSGCGKSTLLAALLKRGWRLLSDDVAPVEVVEGRGVLAWPVRAEVTLWPDSMPQLSFSIPDAGPTTVNVGEKFCANPVPLGAVVRLAVHTGEAVDLSPVEGIDRLEMLANLAYNSRVLEALFDPSTYLSKSAALSQAVGLYRILRPRGHWTVEELADRVDSVWR